MVYIPTWVDFMLLAGDIFKKTDKNPRYVIKLKKKEKAFILKVTDNERCIKFKIPGCNSNQQVLEMNETFMKWCDNEIYGWPEEPEAVITENGQVKILKKMETEDKPKKAKGGKRRRIYTKPPSRVAKKTVSTEKEQSKGQPVKNKN